jgi:hypothetical protein
MPELHPADGMAAKNGPAGRDAEINIIEEER